MQDAFYFMGVDSAPAVGNRADDGALAVLRARPRVPKVLTPNPADWIREYIWAYVLRGASAREWSGFIHLKHRQFGLTRLCIDPQGGGQWIMQELNKSRQIINQVETEVTPICSLIEQGVVHGDFILMVFKPTDPSLKQLWPMATHPENLNDNMHVTFQQDMEHGQIWFPPKYDQVPREERGNLNAEADWAWRHLSDIGQQLNKIQVATKESGEWELTARNARKFSSSGRKDKAYAAMYADVAFLAWLKTNGGEFEHEAGGDAMVSFM